MVNDPKMMWTRKKMPTAQRLVMKGSWIPDWGIENELARTLAVVTERSVRLENAPPQSTGEAGGTHEEAETTE
jgi:hypothetical protein